MGRVDVRALEVNPYKNNWISQRFFVFLYLNSSNPVVKCD